MSGYHTVLLIRRLEEELCDLGFMMCYPKHRWSGDREEDMVSIKPKDADSLPIYARDAEIFTGTLEQVNQWVKGVAWARNYDSMLRLSNDKKRLRKEQDYRNDALARLLASQEKEAAK